MFCRCSTRAAELAASDKRKRRLKRGLQYVANMMSSRTFGSWTIRCKKLLVVDLYGFLEKGMEGQETKRAGRKRMRDTFDEAKQLGLLSNVVGCPSSNKVPASRWGDGTRAAAEADVRSIASRKQRIELLSGFLMQEMMS